MKYILLSCLLLCACQKDRTPEQHVKLISSDMSVQITDIPSAPALDANSYEFKTYLGNINFHSRVDHIEDLPIGTITKVYVKPSNESSWQELQVLHVITKEPNYVYDMAVHEIRFHNCRAGWGYTIFVINPK